MTIKRLINGKEIEIKLTEHEMWDAYREQEHEFDMEDVRSTLKDIDDDEIPETLTDEQIDDAACWAREWLDDNDHISELRWDIIHDAIKEALK